MSTLEKRASDVAHMVCGCADRSQHFRDVKLIVEFANKYAAEMVRKASCKIYQIGINVSEEEWPLDLAKAINLAVDDCFVFADRIEKGEET